MATDNTKLLQDLTPDQCRRLIALDHSVNLAAIECLTAEEILPYAEAFEGYLSTGEVEYEREPAQLKLIEE